MLRADSVRLTTVAAAQEAELLTLRGENVRLAMELGARIDRDQSAPTPQPRRGAKTVAA